MTEFQSYQLICKLFLVVRASETRPCRVASVDATRVIPVKHVAFIDEFKVEELSGDKLVRGENFVQPYVMGYTIPTLAHFAGFRMVRNSHLLTMSSAVSIQKSS